MIRRRSLLSRGTFAAVFAVFVVGAAGCNSGSSTPVAHLQGTVTIGGQPVPADAEARIMFMPPATADNRNARPAIVPIVAGKYDAPDVPTGKILVRFDIQQPTGKEFARGMKESRNLVPPEHQEGLAIEVAEGEGQQNFEL
jgi:hypothetical protein